MFDENSHTARSRSMLLKISRRVIAAMYIPNVQYVNCPKMAEYTERCTVKVHYEE